ncbi:hypothetical protein SLE2022_051310 [Rubroshorea leprosula]
MDKLPLSVPLRRGSLRRAFAILRFLCSSSPILSCSFRYIIVSVCKHTWQHFDLITTQVKDKVLTYKLKGSSHDKMMSP